MAVSDAIHGAVEHIAALPTGGKIALGVVTVGVGGYAVYKLGKKKSGSGPFVTPSGAIYNLPTNAGGLDNGGTNPGGGSSGGDTLGGTSGGTSGGTGIPTPTIYPNPPTLFSLSGTSSSSSGGTYQQSQWSSNGIGTIDFSRVGNNVRPPGTAPSDATMGYGTAVPNVAAWVPSDAGSSAPAGDYGGTGVNPYTYMPLRAPVVARVPAPGGATIGRAVTAAHPIQAAATQTGGRTLTPTVPGRNRRQ